MKQMMTPSVGSNRLEHADDDFKRQVLGVLIALKQGDFSARLPCDWVGLDGKVADALNDVAARIQHSHEGLA
jgi:uncharacterized protein Yka (UPF0111/DUF47 family)